MTTAGAISAFYQEFTEALTEVLAENSVGPARRGRLARARAAVKKHPNYAGHEYFLAVENDMLAKNHIFLWWSLRAGAGQGRG